MFLNKKLGTDERYFFCLIVKKNFLETSITVLFLRFLSINSKINLMKDFLVGKGFNFFESVNIPLSSSLRNFY